MRAVARRLAVLVSAVAASSFLVLAGRADVLWVLTDPRGDDRGEGALVYPLRDDLRPGDLDLLRLRARQDRGGTLFEATFARAVRAPGERPIDLGGGRLGDVARLGFYTINLDLYVDTDRKPGSGSVNALPGRRLEIDPAYAWERAIALTPRPYDARSALKRLVARTLKREAREGQAHVDPEQDARIEAEVARDIEGRVFFPTEVHVAGPTIRFWVPGEVLGGPARPGHAYTVVVTAADVEQRFDLGSMLGITEQGPERLMNVAIGPSPSRERFGGGRDGDPVQPWAIDVVVPPGRTQAEVLGAYDARTASMAKLPGVVPAETVGR